MSTTNNGSGIGVRISMPGARLRATRTSRGSGRAVDPERIIWMNHQHSGGSLSEIGAVTHLALESTRRATRGPGLARHDSASAVPIDSSLHRRRFGDAIRVPREATGKFANTGTADLSPARGDHDGRRARSTSRASDVAGRIRAGRWQLEVHVGGLLASRPQGSNLCRDRHSLAKRIIENLRRRNAFVRGRRTSVTVASWSRDHSDGNGAGRTLRGERGGLSK